jgi:uncharacterized protein (DUF362 family)
MSIVSFVEAKGSAISEMKEAIATSLKLIDYKIPSNLKSVAIKANMCYYWDFSTGQTTDPRFVSALIDVIREQTSPDIEISIVESDASAMRCAHAFRLLGYEKMAKEKGVKLVNLSKDETDEAEITVNGKALKLALPRTITQADMRINVPKIKYLTHTTISCSLKNNFGCNPQISKYKYHSMINEVIVGLNKLLKFDLQILDGLMVTGNPPCRLNLVMASGDPVALDAAAAKIIHVNPKKVKHLMLASHEGLGSINFIQRGAQLETFAKKYPKTKLTTKIMVLGYKAALKTKLLDPNFI